MLTRIGIYLKQMYPPQHALANIILSVIFYMMLFKLHRLDFIWSEVTLWTSSISLTLFALMLRIMDEFKDYEDDLVNFPNRPLPSGLVKANDLKVLQTIVILSITVLNIWNIYTLVGAVLCGIYSYLMYKWFFIEKKVRASLPLALITHHPVVYIYFFYLALCFYSITQDFIPYTYFACVPLAFLITNWEISRKLRAPKEEDSYTTYSKIWGAKNATVVALSFQTIVVLSVLAYFYLSNTKLYFYIIFSSVFVLLMTPYFKFYRTHQHKRPMRDYAEALALFTQLTLITHFFLTTYEF